VRPGLGGGSGGLRGGGAGLVLAGLDLLDQLGELAEQAGEPGQQQREQHPGQRVSPRHPLAQFLEDQGKAVGDAGERGRGGLHSGNMPRTSAGCQEKIPDLATAPVGRLCSPMLAGTDLE
jgi:hypothetical protein